MTCNLAGAERAASSVVSVWELEARELRRVLGHTILESDCQGNGLHFQSFLGCNSKGRGRIWQNLTGMCLKPINKTSKKLLAFLQLPLVIFFFPNLNDILPLQLRAEYCSKVRTLRAKGRGRGLTWIGPCCPDQNTIKPMRVHSLGVTTAGKHPKGTWGCGCRTRLSSCRIGMPTYQLDGDH